MESRRCLHCGQLFDPRPQRPNQQYCSGSDCQRARKRQWQLEKLHNDPDYQVNQREAQRIWREGHTDYWRKYRAEHPEYVARNRNRKRETSSRDAERLVAKMDVSDMPSGMYWIRVIAPYSPKDSGSWLAEIRLLSTDVEYKKDACKERM